MRVMRRGFGIGKVSYVNATPFVDFLRTASKNTISHKYRANGNSFWGEKGE